MGRASFSPEKKLLKHTFLTQIDTFVKSEYQFVLILPTQQPFLPKGKRGMKPNKQKKRQPRRGKFPPQFSLTLWMGFCTPRGSLP